LRDDPSADAGLATGACAKRPNASAFLLTFPQPEADRVNWQHAAKLILQTADDPSGPAIAAATRQIEQALFVSYRFNMASDAGATAKTRRSSSRSDSSTRTTPKSGNDSSN
jgi:hypothetical protein